MGHTRLRELTSDGGRSQEEDNWPAAQCVQESAAAGGAEPELLDPVSDLKVNAFELVGDIREHQRLLAARASTPCHWCGRPPYFIQKRKTSICKHENMSYM